MPESAMPITPFPLFSLEFSADGTVLAPESLSELLAWLETENAFWAWSNSLSGGGVVDSLRAPLGQLSEARSATQQALQFQTHNDANSVLSLLNTAKSFLTAVYIDAKLPFSKSELGQRAEAMRLVSPNAAASFLFTKMNSQGRRFDAFDLDSWGGFIEGVLDNKAMAGIPDRAFGAANARFSELNGNLEKLLLQRSREYQMLRKEYADLVEEIKVLRADQEKTFAARLDAHNEIFTEGTADHQSKMEGIQSAFKEGMRLRGPVGYWEGRKILHSRLALGFGAASFLGMAGLAIAVTLKANALFSTLGPNQNPSTWQLAILISMAVFGAWAVRLLVRIFLSNSHLATDAAERVVMTLTYLALIEENRVSEDKDRTLILSSLFRPATDGMVKEEAIPHPALDALTKLSGNK